MASQPILDIRTANELFRARLIEARRAAGLTQMELAERLGEYQSFVSKVETGERGLSPIELLVVLSALNVNPAEFVRGLAQELSIRPGMQIRRRRKEQN